MLAGRPILPFAEFVALGNLFAGVKVGSCSNHNASVVILDSWGGGREATKKLVGTAIYGLYTAILKYVAAKGMVSSSLVCVKSGVGWSNGSWQRVSFCRKLISCSSLEFGLD